MVQRTGFSGQTSDGGPRHRLGRFLGLVGALVAGFLLTILAGVATVFLLFDSAAETAGFIALFCVLTLTPAAGLWFTRNRYWRAVAFGLTGSCAITVYVLFVWVPWSTMNDQEREQATTRIIATGVPAFYLGDEADGYSWNDYYLTGDEVGFLYGRCHDSSESGEGGCTDWDITVDSEPTNVSRTGDFIAWCKRLDPVLDVPTVQLYDEVALFTGTTMVMIDVADGLDLERQVELAASIRALGESEPAQRLLPPTAAVMAYVERYCGG